MIQNEELQAFRNLRFALECQEIRLRQLGTKKPKVLRREHLLVATSIGSADMYSAETSQSPLMSGRRTRGTGSWSEGSG